MTPGKFEDARALAVARWATLHDFDLDGATWESLFERYHAGHILEAVTLTKFTRSKNPDIIFQRFEFRLEKLAAKHYAA
jgi:hypothetical protein